MTALREQLPVLISTGKCKEATGVNLTHKQVRRLEDKDVMRHIKRYQAYVGARTTETLIESFLVFSTKVIGCVVRLKDAEALKNELKNDYIVTKELSDLSGNLALSVISIIVSLVGVYYKREGVFTRASPPSPVVPLAPPPVDTAPKRIRMMD